MKKSTAARAAAFIGALGASAALVGAAVSTTGAYFTDSHPGTINAGTGTVKVDTTDTSLNFANLLPGEYKTASVEYTARGTGSQDLWFVPTGADNPLVGANGNTALGRYGHFKLTSTAGASFVSNNLRSDPNDTNRCPVNEYGHGGSTQEAGSAAERPYPPLCGVPGAILLQQNMNAGDRGAATIEFGYTKLLTGPQGAATAPLASYRIVATQHGVRPDDPNN